MKKFLLCMLLAGLMMPVVAQEKMKVREKIMKSQPASKAVDLGLPVLGFPMDSRGALVGVDGWVYAGTTENGYDLQTQGGVYPMAKVHDDKSFIGCIWTSNDAPKFPESLDGANRNVAYAYSEDGGETWSEQENRLGGIPVYWGSYAQWGKNGEAVMARSYYDHEYEGVSIKDGLVLFTRATRGTGDWTITPVPYPADARPENFMAWGSMATSGEDHQYIHIITPMSNQDIPNILYHGYNTPMLYFRTQDGKTWEVAGEVVPEMVGQEWGAESYYADALSFAVQGNTIACSIISFGSDAYVIRSYDNGETWTSIKFFDSPIERGLSTVEYADTAYIPTQGCLALDNNGKMHIVFSAVMGTNSESTTDGTIMYFSGFSTSFLSYWDEGMAPIDGEATFALNEIEPLLWDEYFDFDQSEEGKFYVISTLPKMPVIGYYTPTLDEHIITIDRGIIQDWGGGSYGVAGGFSFPQMIFDVDNTLHLAYLGFLDNGGDDGRWMRHPYYTTRNEDGIWTQTEYLVNAVDLIDREFAYLTSAGFSEKHWHLMAQVDQSAGTHIPAGTTTPSDHSPTKNYFYFFYIKGITAINEVDYTPLTMTVYPNPASGQATVYLEGRKGNITVHNMLGQTVYQAEAVGNFTNIPLNNMATGVYFVTVRSGNATATQKLIVK